MDVGAWLRDLGLGQYEQAFRDNDIDDEVLPRLTAEDLIGLGVTSIGHRRKLLDAIAALRNGTSPAPTPAAGVEAEPATAAAAPRSPEAERRQLTVMFADLVGSTALAARLDPEDLREVIGAYQRCAAEVIGRFEGLVAKFLGDGVLAYFGYPQAHEDDAERAVRAGLDLAEAVGGLAPRENLSLRVRVGIATGLVVVGDLIGEGAAREEAVVGETPNLAARLQALAEPNSVVIAPGTRRLLGGLFDLADLGVHDLKGFAASVPAWRVLGPSAAESRFEARQTTGLTPLVGREEELALLLQRWELAKAGEGQVVLLSGEPGIGKSRLLRTLRERLTREPHMPLSHFCSPYHTNSALHPMIGLLERAAGFEREDPAERRLDKLEAVLALAAEEVREAAPLLADLLGIPTGGRYPPLDLGPQRRKEKTLQALLGQLAGLATRQPVLALYEDVHWADPSTLGLLGLVVERVQRLPVMVVITSRPEFVPPWTGRGHVTALALNRLGRRQGAALVERVTGGKALPAQVAEQIAAKADGIPLFVEELTKAVLESGLLREQGDRYELTGPLPPPAVPATLHDSLMARLDRLGPAKEVAQVAAVIGREFGHELLAAVAPVDRASLEDALDRLVAAELVFRRGVPPETAYSFKHALVRDAAYQSLLRSRRRGLHARVAEVLEERFPEAVETEPELLAHHCTHAGLAEKAIRYRYRAGQRAIGRSAMAEAVAQLKQGLELLTGLPDGPGRRRRELDLQVALGGALIAAKGYAAEETGRAFARARELCREEGDVQLLLRVLNGQVLFHIDRDERQAAHEIAAEMLELARREGRGEPALLIPAHRALSLASFELGRFAAAREHAERVLALYDPARHHALTSLYAFDQRIVALGYLCVASFVLGFPDQARVRGREQLAEAQRLGHPSTLAQALYRACIFGRHARDAERVRQAADALVAIAGEHGLSFFLAIGRIHGGWVSIQRGKVEEGLSEIQQGAAEAAAVGTPLSPAYVSGLIAEALAVTGRHREAVSWMGEALTGMGDDASPWFEGDRYRRCGQLLLLLPEPKEAEAEDCFRRALEVARAQDARMWELRAAIGLARLWRDQGRRGEARDLLAPVYGWFTEGFDTPDLKEARALLDELPSAPPRSQARARQRSALR